MGQFGEPPIVLALILHLWFIQVLATQIIGVELGNDVL